MRSKKVDVAEMLDREELNPERIHCAKNKLSAEENKIKRKIEANQEKIDCLNKRLDKLMKKSKNLRDKCKHRNTTSKTGIYGMTYRVCDVCGKFL